MLRVKSKNIEESHSQLYLALVSIAHKHSINKKILKRDIIAADKAIKYAADIEWGILAYKKNIRWNYESR